MDFPCLGHSTGPRITEHRATLREGSALCKMSIALATEMGAQVRVSQTSVLVREFIEDRAWGELLWHVSSTIAHNTLTDSSSQHTHRLY